METTPTNTEGVTVTPYDAAVSGGGPEVYEAGFRYVIIGKRGRVVHAITKNGKTACNGTLVNVLSDRAFMSWADATYAVGNDGRTYNRFCAREENIY